MPKKIETRVTGGINGGIHDTRAYKNACNMLHHNYVNAQLWHMTLIPLPHSFPSRKDFEVALTRVVEKLRDSGMPVQFKAAYELCLQKGFHRHCYMLIEAKDHKPAGILRYRPNGWLVEMLKEHGLGFYIAPPQNAIHRTAKGHQKKYAYVPKTPGAALDDCKEWLSYIFKVRTKAGVDAPIYSSSRVKTKTIKESKQ